MSRRLVMVVVGIGAMAFALAGCFGNGPHAVGTGQQGLVAPGLYRTLGDDGGFCSVTRYDASNVPITFYQNLTGGPLYIQIKPTDGTVTSTNCKLWQAAGFVPPIPDLRSGDARVGYDVQAGVYKATGTGPGTGLCTYQRVRDFAHDNSSVIETHTVQATETPIIEIKSTDFGFWSQNCGDWVKQ